MVSYFSQSKGQGPAKSFFVAHHPFFKVLLQQQKIDIALIGTFGLFFASCLSTIPTISLLISSSNFSQL
jgi:hypothetical protein